MNAERTGSARGMGEREGYVQADVDLEGIVDAPLQAGECTNHDDAQRQAAREQRKPAHLLDDIAHGGALHGVQLAHLKAHGTSLSTCPTGRTIRAQVSAVENAKLVAEVVQ